MRVARRVTHRAPGREGGCGAERAAARTGLWRERRTGPRRTRAGNILILIVLTPQVRDTEMLRAMTDLLGFEPTWTGGAWIWNVGPLVDNPSTVLTGPDIS